MKPNFLLLPILVATTFLPALGQAEHKREVVPQVDGEMPDFSIARELPKQKAAYPFISPIREDAVPGVITQRDLVYRQLGERQLTLDIVTPEMPTGKSPAVIMIHGGGWRTGNKNLQLPLAQALAGKGVVGVTVEYRLSREALYPAGIHDIQAAIRWVKSHAEEYNIDANKIAILGASSGAQMVTLVGNIGRFKRFAGEPTTVNGVDSRVQAIINVDGVVDLVSPEARQFEDKPGKLSYAALWLGGRFADLPNLWREVSPLTYAGPESPPTLFINSAQPRFHVGRDEYVAILDQHNIYSDIHTLPDTPHAFWLFHPWFDTELQQIQQFLAQVFGSEPHTARMPDEPLSTSRIAGLDKDKERAWQSYLERSHTAQLRDQQQFNGELSDASETIPMPAPALEKTSTTADAVRQWQDTPLSNAMITHLLSWQTPSGGWAKNTDFYSAARQPAQEFGVEQDYAPTFDNGATTLQIRILADAYQRKPSKALAQALKAGIQLLSASQFPNGGFPQTYPLVGGYHDLTTYNDGVTAQVVQLLQDVVAKPRDYAVQSKALQTQLQTTLTKAIDNILADQRSQGDKLTGWGQQHDPLDHQLRPARAFEMAALATMESADILIALMRQPNPDSPLKNAVMQGIDWLQANKINDTEWRLHRDRDSELIASPGAPAIWPRFIDNNTGDALFGDRDGNIYHKVTDVSLERQLGYAWYHPAPQKALDQYDHWAELYLGSNL